MATAGKDAQEEDDDALADDQPSGSKRKQHPLEEFMTRGDRCGAGPGGSFKWTCKVCSRDGHPQIFTGSSSKVITHFRMTGSGHVKKCQGIFNDPDSQATLRDAKVKMQAHMDMVASEKKVKHQSEVAMLLQMAFRLKSLIQWKCQNSVRSFRDMLVARIFTNPRVARGWLGPFSTPA